MKKVNIFIIALLCVLAMSSTTTTQAQEDGENKGAFSLGVDLMSRYTWRGIDYGAAPSIQPTLAFSKGGFEIGYWGAYSTNVAGFQETDLYLGYTFMNDMLSVGIIDYYYPNILALDQDYFNFNGDETGHTLEASLAFNGTENLPLSLAIYTCVYGADKVFSDSVLNTTTNMYDYNAKDAYSTYIELGYSLEVQDVAVDLYAGYLLNGTDVEDAILPGGCEGFYCDGPGLINLGMTASKEIQITDKWSLPVSSSLVYNAKRQRVFFVFGMSF
jgi:hypothetical protein